MRRARDALRAGWWWAVALASLAWWGPAILLALGALVANRVRFALVIAATSTLREVGATGAALAIYRRERRRCDKRLAVIRARRAHFTSARDEA